MIEKNKNFSVTKFVTLNIAKDFLNEIKDFLGLEQKTYSELVNEVTNEMLKEIEKDGSVIWFRQIIDKTFNKSIQITIYGQQRCESENTL